MSRLWLQRLRLRRLRRWRLRFRRLLLIVGHLPFLLIRDAPCWHRQAKIFGRVREATRPILVRTTGV